MVPFSQGQDIKMLRREIAQRTCKHSGASVNRITTDYRKNKTAPSKNHQVDMAALLLQKKLF
jgi:hypothetical protein